MTQKITYVTSSDRMDEIHGEFDAAVERVRERLGQTHPMLIDGNPVTASGTFADISPIDTRIVLGHFQSGEGAHIDQAVAAARRAFGEWGRMPWRERVTSMRRLADAIRADRWDLSALMGFECGKNRMECLGDVEESADLIDYYCDQIDHADGFVRPMQPLGPAERNSSVLRPYGVWGGHFPVQLPARARSGPGRCGARRWKYGSDQAGDDDPVDRRALRRARPRCRPATGRAERCYRRWRHRWSGVDRSCRGERRGVHRIEGSRPEAAARECQPRDASAGDHRDGR
jgi:hypothetical protein